MVETARLVPPTLGAHATFNQQGRKDLKFCTMLRVVSGGGGTVEGLRLFSVKPPSRVPCAGEAHDSTLNVEDVGALSAPTVLALVPVLKKLWKTVPVALIPKITTWVFDQERVASPAVEPRPAVAPKAAAVAAPAAASAAPTAEAQHAAAEQTSTQAVAVVSLALSQSPWTLGEGHGDQTI